MEATKNQYFDLHLALNYHHHLGLEQLAQLTECLLLKHVHVHVVSVLGKRIKEKQQKYEI